jgi:DNA-directed RNA polymerase subunit RPC12/RpoP
VASTTEPNEYQCSNCRAKFHFVQPHDGTVVTDTRAHHCPLCGRPVQTTVSYMCTECKKPDFCDSCVTAVPFMGTKRFVCRECTKQHGWACSRCGKFAPVTCIVCGRRGCSDHTNEFFAHSQGRLLVAMNCPSCAGLVCTNCAERGGLLSRSSCKKCHTKLTAVFGKTSYCGYCHHVTGDSSVCASCGKAVDHLSVTIAVTKTN